jgi:hypothetical protein
MLILLADFSSIYELVVYCLQKGQSIKSVTLKKTTDQELPFDELYTGQSHWEILPAFDHPTDPLHCMLSGTGLTHKASAENRQKMHKSHKTEDLTDSMKMYQWGVQGGRPKVGEIGVQPEWFYKGNGTNLRSHLADLEVPAFADDGGEEPEVAGIYVNDAKGQPFRVGFATANEFSDHIMERKNYLYLAPSKIRTCALGPELVLDCDFQKIDGEVSVSRDGKTIWEKSIRTGEANMAHSLANLEYHHFKYPKHQVPGQIHIHFYGADAFSFGEGMSLEHGDLMRVFWQGLGRALLNSLSVSPDSEDLIHVSTLS